MAQLRDIVAWTIRSLAIVHLSLLLFLSVWAGVFFLSFSDARAAVLVSGSMEPLIRPGDLVVFDRVATDDLGVGDVVLVDDPADPGHLLTHRLFQVGPDGKFVTKGDANAAVDSDPVPPDSVLGRGRLVVPFIGRAALWRTGEGQVWAVTLAASLMVLTRDVMNRRPRPRYVPRHSLVLPTA